MIPGNADRNRHEEKSVSKCRLPITLTGLTTEIKAAKPSETLPAYVRHQALYKARVIDSSRLPGTFQVSAPKVLFSGTPLPVPGKWRWLVTLKNKQV